MEEPYITRSKKPIRKGYIHVSNYMTFKKRKTMEIERLVFARGWGQG